MLATHWKYINQCTANGSYAWTCPNVSTVEAEIRVSDAWDANPSDLSTGPFRIRLPQLTADPTDYDFGGVNPETTVQHTLALSNPGEATIVVTSITSSNPRFWPGRTSVSIAAGGADTVGLYYRPTAVQPDTAQVTLNSAQGATPVQLRGHGLPPVGVEDGERPVAFALYANRPNPFSGRTLIRYALPVRQRVTIDVYDLQGHRVSRLVDGEQGPGNFSVPFGSAVANDGRRLSSGVYFVRIETGGYRASRKILMLQ